MKRILEKLKTRSQGGGKTNDVHGRMQIQREEDGDKGTRGKRITGVARSSTIRLCRLTRASRRRRKVRISTPAAGSVGGQGFFGCRPNKEKMFTKRLITVGVGKNCKKTQLIRQRETFQRRHGI